MGNINEKKRCGYRKRLIVLLSEILNDSAVMPNADCNDLAVVVTDVAFGRTVRDIYVSFHGFWKNPDTARTSHDRYRQQALADNGYDAYSDLTDVALSANLMQIIEEEVQRRFGLSYRPKIRRLCDRLEE